MIIENVDFGFIAKFEGMECIGYVPDPEGSNSGVTIACGFDLGQRCVSDLEAKFPGSLGKKLSFYAGLKKLKAQQYLHDNPLEVSAQEADAINRVVFVDVLESLKDCWVASKPFTGFQNLSVNCATVICSVAFQYGNLPKRTPVFWSQVTSGDWSAAVQNLRHFGDSYPARRNAEADYMSQWLTRKDV